MLGLHPASAWKGRNACRTPNLANAPISGRFSMSAACSLRWSSPRPTRHATRLGRWESSPARKKGHGCLGDLLKLEARSGGRSDFRPPMGPYFGVRRNVLLPACAFSAEPILWALRWSGQARPDRVGTNQVGFAAKMRTESSKFHRNPNVERLFPGEISNGPCSRLRAGHVGPRTFSTSSSLVQIW